MSQDSKQSAVRKETEQAGDGTHKCPKKAADIIYGNCEAEQVRVVIYCREVLEPRGALDDARHDAYCGHETRLTQRRALRRLTLVIADKHEAKSQDGRDGNAEWPAIEP